jgi:hypothetical protein
VTTTGAPASLSGLPATLADIVLWTVFTLQGCTDDEIDAQLSTELQNVIGDTLRGLAVSDRLTLLEHAGRRAEKSKVADYQRFLVDLAETMGLE